MTQFLAAALTSICLEVAGYTQECVRPCWERQVQAVVMPPLWEGQKPQLMSCRLYLILKLTTEA